MRPAFRRQIRTGALLLALALLPSRAQALDSDYRAVATAGLYGAAIGTLAGIVSAPLSSNSRNIFIGTSVGLYLGLAVGLYHVTHRDDPGNPLRGELSPVPPMHADYLPPAPNESSAGKTPAALVQVNFEVKRF